MTRKSRNVPMRLALAGAIAGWATLPPVPSHAQSDGSSRSGGDGMAPARDPDIAVQEEFEAARRQGTTAAWELFIARHPDHPLADAARQELRRLNGG